MLRTAVAIGVYVAFWIAVLFGYLTVDSSGVLHDLLRGLAVVLPALVLGLLVNRWWVVLAGLVFLVAVPFPERSAIDGTGVDVTLTGTYDVSLTDALELIALTTPWILLGVLVRRYAKRPRVLSRKFWISFPSGWAWLTFDDGRSRTAVRRGRRRASGASRRREGAHELTTQDTSAGSEPATGTTSEARASSAPS